MQEEKIDRLIGFYGWLTKVGLSAQQALQANAARQQLLEAIEAGVEYQFNGSKACTGELSPGCLTCGRGTWSCLFINGLCTAHCFFCPQDRSMTEERPPFAEELLFENADTYLDYLDRLSFKGVGFSGGETFLVFDKLVTYIEKVRRRFADMYIWIYTNGDLVDSEKLAVLNRAGLNEIRFNISARNYDMQPVTLARRFIQTVTIEIPTIPEYKEWLKRCMLEMDRIGVDHLNLHQLVATRYNYERLARHNYTFLPPLAFHEPPVLESELAALELIAYARENHLKTPINYCSHAYKARYQNLSRRQRAAREVCKDYQEVTAAGYIRSIVLCEPKETLAAVITRLRSGGVPENCWALVEGGDELSVHPLGLRYLELDTAALVLKYTEADIVSPSFLKSRKLEKIGQIVLGEEQGDNPTIYLGVKDAGEPVSISVAAVKKFATLFNHPVSWENMQPSSTLSADDIQALQRIRPFELISSGFQEITATR